MSYNVDISGETKFTVRHLKYDATWSSGAISNKTTYAYWVGNNSAYSGVSALNLNDPVNTKTNWGQYSSSSNWNLASYFSSSSYGGNFPGTSGKYIGIKFQVSGNTHYGWIQVDIPADVSSVTISGYAYNDTPAGPITAGQIPEPAGLGLLACGAAGILALRRKPSKA